MKGGQWVGLGLSTLGGVVTVVGLLWSMWTLFGNDNVIAVAWRKLTRKKREPQIFYRYSHDSAKATDSATGIAEAHNPIVVTDGPVSWQQIVQLNERIERTEQTIARVRQELAEADRRLSDALDAQQAATSAQIAETSRSLAQVRASLPEAVGGRRGSGLFIAAVGVALTIAGDLVMGFCA